MLPLSSVLLSMGLSYYWFNQGLTPTQAGTLWITLICAIWWLLEPIPIAITGLIPLALCPMFGILQGEELAMAYGHPMIMLLLGGFMMSKSMEQVGAHKRMALWMIQALGGDCDQRLVAGFMVASAALSMWISNTATTLMLLPVALAILNESPNPQLESPLLLGIAYAASLGGIATPVGTPPNLIFLGAYEEYTGRSISFGQWIAWALPIVLVILPIMIFWLTRNLKQKQVYQLPKLGPLKKSEATVMGIFLLTALLWVTRLNPFGGWSQWLHLPQVNDASIAVLAVLALSLARDSAGQSLLPWAQARSIPWGVLLLFGGGIALAKAFVKSGLSDLIGAYLGSTHHLPILVMIAAISLCVSLLTEVTSNTATANLLMPILASTAMFSNLEPAILMVPATISASCAFMLPIATAPNTIVYGSERIKMRQMLQEGFLLNCLAVLVTTFFCYALIS